MPACLQIHVHSAAPLARLLLPILPPLADYISPRSPRNRSLIQPMKKTYNSGLYQHSVELLTNRRSAMTDRDASGARRATRQDRTRTLPHTGAPSARVASPALPAPSRVFDCGFGFGPHPQLSAPDGAGGLPLASCAPSRLGFPSGPGSRATAMGAGQTACGPLQCWCWCGGAMRIRPYGRVWLRFLGRVI